MQRFMLFLFDFEFINNVYESKEGHLCVYLHGFPVVFSRKSRHFPLFLVWIRLNTAWQNKAPATAKRR